MTPSRRAFLSGLAAGTSGWLAGCGSVAGRREPVEVLAAGSLQTALAEGLREAVATPVAVEAHGSVAAARLVERGERDPDVVALADTALFTDRLDAWHATFATNELAVATADTAGGRRVAEADRWFQPLVDGTARLGRTDPALDPLGYRTLFALRLAGDHYDRPTLAEDVLGPDQVYPETALAASVETGAVDAAVLYRTMADDHGLPTRDLPAAIDLGSADHAEDYADLTYELPDGSAVRGDVIRYGATLRRRTTAAERVFDALVGGEYLPTFGFDAPDDYPRYTEDAPALS